MLSGTVELALNPNGGLALLCELPMSQESRFGNCFLSQNLCDGQGINITTDMSHSLYCKLWVFCIYLRIYGWEKWRCCKWESTIVLFRLVSIYPKRMLDANSVNFLLFLEKKCGPTYHPSISKCIMTWRKHVYLTETFSLTFWNMHLNDIFVFPFSFHCNIASLHVNMQQHAISSWLVP